MAQQIHPKVTAGVLAGAITGILVSELSRRGIPIDAAEGSNITMVATLIAGWFMPSDDAAAPVPSEPASAAAPASSGTPPGAAA